MDKISISIWGVALVLYLAFLGWHENWRGPMNVEEKSFYTAYVDTRQTMNAEQKKALLDFIENDDGKEFIMVNLVAHRPGMVAHPDSGAPITGPALLNEYFLPFMGKIVGRAGYPAYTGEAAGGYLDIWNSAANPGWTGSGLIRYRSRRDLLAAIANPAFADSHIYKQAALAATLAVPLRSSIGLYVSPRIWLALLLIALAALAHLAYALKRGRDDREV